MRAPIIVMSFNRPQFLASVLESLRGQLPGTLDGREIHLFQDGAVNRYSRLRRARDEEIAASIDIFRKHFPDGAVHHSDENIGVCENFQRAERYAFLERQFDCAYFLEDDLVLSPAYLDMMQRLQAWAESVLNVAYFAAYGNFYAGPDEISQLRRELTTLDHHWAFGLLRRHWVAMQPFLEPFYRVVVGTDYSRRDHRGVFALYQSLDAAPRASSQDAAKAFACDRLGLWRCNTVVPFARYIGTVGEHMKPEAFETLGFERTEVATESIGDLAWPDDSSIAARLAEQRELFKDIRRAELAQIIEVLPQRRYNPLRLCDRSDVIFGYRLFLRREPASEAEIEVAAGRKTVFDFVNGLVISDEYQKLGDDRPRRLCTRDDVLYAYRLCLQRDPENDQVFEAHVGKRDATTVVLAIWNGPERPKLWQRIEGESHQV